VLIILGGRSGAGKTTLARALATAIGAMHLRIDSIEQALRNIGRHVEADGYVAAHAVAEDNLRLGRTVIADCVNPWPLTRAAWRSVATRAGVRSIDVEVICSDVDEHRRRVESRIADIPGHQVPTWAEVVERDYRPWDTDRIIIDTAQFDPSGGVDAILSAGRIEKPVRQAG
jgi:predicted kinase